MQNLKGKSILIFGGTGAMGKAMVELLNSEGAFVDVTSRFDHENYGRVKYIKCNAKSDSALDGFAKQKWDVLIDFMVYNTNEFKKRADALLSIADQYIFISSARVYADSKNAISEDSLRLIDTVKDEKYLATDEYALAKARQENILFDHVRKNWTIVRPSLTYSEGRLQLQALEVQNWLYRALHGRSIPFTSNMADNLVTMTYGGDVAKGISALMCNKSCYGKTYHIVQSEPHSWKEILNIYLSAVEQKTGIIPKIKYIDKPIDTGLWRLKYGKYFNRKFDNSRIGELVDVSEFLKPETGLKFCVSKCIDNEQWRNINWILEARIDRAVSEFTPLKEIPGGKDKIKYILERFNLNRLLSIPAKIKRILKKRFLERNDSNLNEQDTKCGTQYNMGSC